MVLKVLIRKSDRKILFVEGQEDFADFIFGFLTLPLGGVLHMLGGFSSYSCLDKLYKSVTELCPYRYLMSPSLKHMLVNPQCAPQFGIYNQILQIGDLPVFYCKSYEKDMKQISVLVNSTKSLRLYGELYKTMDIVDPKSSDGKSNSGGFVIGPAMYMVTDDLVVTPISSISGVSYLNRSKVHLSDLEQRVINIGLKEVMLFLRLLSFCYSMCSVLLFVFDIIIIYCTILQCLSILKASLISTSALTNGLEKFIMPDKVLLITCFRSPDFRFVSVTILHIYKYFNPRCNVSLN